MTCTGIESACSSSSVRIGGASRRGRKFSKISVRYRASGAGTGVFPAVADIAVRTPTLPSISMKTAFSMNNCFRPPIPEGDTSDSESTLAGRFTA